MFTTADRYSGLPIPTPAEAAVLRAEVDLFLADEPNALEELYDQILERVPLLQDVIDSDVKLFVDHESAEDLKRDDLHHIENGIRMGYGLTVGALALIWLQRTETDDICKLPDVCEENVIPLQTRHEKDRVWKVRSGKAVVDIALRDQLRDSRDLANFDAEKYINRADAIGAIFEDQLIEQLQADGPYAHILDREELDSTPFAWGFWHGVANAIEMYIQSNEERLIRRLDRAS